MINLSGSWQGYFAGTNRGIIFLNLQHNDSLLKGSGNFNDFDLGVTNFDCEGEARGDQISIKLINFRGGKGIVPSQVTVTGEILNDGAGLAVSWSSDVGTNGRAVLSRPAVLAPYTTAAFFSRPVNLKSYRLDAASFSGLLEVCLRGMQSAPVFKIIERDVTHIKTGLDELVKSWQAWPDETINEITISVSDNAAGLTLKEILLELKRTDVNRLTVTSADSVWVDGIIEQIRKYLDKYRARLNHVYRRYGTWINSIIFIGMLVWLPSLPSVISRIYFVVGTFMVLFALLFFYNRLLPNTEIFVREQKPTFFRRNRDALMVSIVTVVAGTIITALGKIILDKFNM